MCLQCCYSILMIFTTLTLHIFFQISKSEFIALWENIDMVQESGSPKEIKEKYFFTFLL